ncbi:MAG: lipoprotein [Huintestinicola sp.]
MKIKKVPIIIGIILVLAAIITAVLLVGIGHKGKLPFPTVSEQKVENGNYYFRGDISQCYFLIYNETIKLVGTSDQLHELHDNISAQEDYDEWYNADISDFLSQKDFIVLSTVNGETIIAWHWNTDDKGNIISYTGLSYNTDGSIHYIDDFVRK